MKDVEKGVIGIYKITSPSGKIYIGQSRCIRKRWVRYRKHHCKSQPKIYNSLIKYGFDKHTFEIIEECTFEELNLRERFWQDYYDVLGENGLNLVLVNSEDKPYVYSEDVKKKMSLAKEGMYFGEDNPFFGKTHTEQTRNRLSEANFEFLKGNPHSSLGRKASDEERKRMSESRKGKYTGHKNPMYGVPSPMTGKYHTEESKRKISEANKGKLLGNKASYETRLKMSNSRTGEGNSRAKMCIHTTTGIYFGCIKDAAIAFNIPIKRLQENLRLRKYYRDIIEC